MSNRITSLRLFALTIAFVVVPAGIAGAASGGMGVTAEGVTKTGEAALTQPLTDEEFRAAPVATGGIRFGSRILRQGMKGRDVRVLNGIIRSKSYARRVKLSNVFHARTSGAVRRFQAEHSISPSGVVNRRTARLLAGSMSVGKTTWYGPGFYGNTTACGQRLGYNTVGVAHRTLPCGTRVTFHYRGKSVVAPVIDRGPFVRGILWDLTGAAATQLGFSGSGPIRYAISR